jgi:hypothetical protein
MPVLATIQPTTPALGQTGSPSSLPGSHGHAGAFAALLSGSMQPGRLPGAQPAVGPPVPRSLANAAEEPNQLAQLVQNEDDSGATPEATGAELLPAANSPPTKQAAVHNRGPLTLMGQVDRSGRTIRRSAAVQTSAGPYPVAGDAIPLRPAQPSAGTRIVLAAAVQVADSSNRGASSAGLSADGTTVAPGSTAIAAQGADGIGNALNARALTQIGTERDAAPTEGGTAGPGGSPATPINPGSWPPPTTAQAGSPTGIVLPEPTLTASAVAARGANKIDPREGVDQRRAISGSPRNERPAKPDDTVTAAPAGASAGDVKADSFAARHEAAPGASVLPTSSNGPQLLPAATGVSPTAPSTPDQPVETADRTAPVDQVAPALIGLLKTTDGTQSITMRLQPAELGQVDIRVDQTAQGTSHVAITAERTETLALLQHDEPRLQQALDQAGVSSSGRTVSFQVAPPPVDASASRPDSMAAGSGGSGQGQSGGAWRQSSDQHNPGNSPEAEQGRAQARWFRAGLDITA